MEIFHSALAPQAAQLGEHEPAEGEQRAAGCHPGERLAEDDDRAHNGDHRREKNVETRLHRAKMADRRVPGDKAER